jgi:toxin ParE1/3/4
LSKYTIKILTRALCELDSIYTYVAKTLLSPNTAVKFVDEVEGAILKLEELPYRGAERKVGAFAKRGYRQIFIRNYTIIYRIDEAKKQVVIVTIHYSPSQF